jgi:hypothetical protein
VKISLRIERFLIILACFLPLLLFFPAILLNPSEYLLQWEGDGTAIYFYTIFHAGYEKGTFTHTINYPYGESLFFLTNILVPKAFQVLHWIGLPKGLPMLAVFNLSLLITIPVAVYLVYLILIRFKLPRWYSIIGSLVIICLSPSLSVLPGFFHIASVFIAPSQWLCLIKYFENDRKWKWLILFTVLSITYTFLSVYYSIFSFLFGATYTLIYAGRKWRKNISDILKWILFPLIPVALVAFIFKFYLTAVNDRVQLPAGADCFGIPLFVLPPYLLDFQLIRKLTGIPRHIVWEGIVYFGWIGVPLVLIACQQYFAPRKNALTDLFKSVPAEITAAIPVALFLFILSTNLIAHMGLFDLHPALASFKQLRGFSRLSWYCYFLLMPVAIFTLYKLWEISLTVRSKLTIQVFIAVGGAGLLLESIFIPFALNKKIEAAHQVHSATDFFSEEGNYHQCLILNGRSASEFSCILSLPFTNSGSDKMAFYSAEGFYQAAKASYNLRLPMLGGIMNRTSITQAGNAMQLFGHPLAPKKILDDFPSQKDILVIETTDSVPDVQRKILGKARLIASLTDVKLHALPIDSLRTWTPTYFLSQYGFQATERGRFIFEGFESGTNNLSYSGKHSFYQRKISGPIYQTNLPPLNDSVLQVSFWFYADERKYGLPQFSIELIADSAIVQKVDVDETGSCTFWNRWIQAEAIITCLNEVSQLRVMVEGEFVAMDHLLIRSAGDNIVQEVDGKTFLNGLPVLQ